jgi:hypothetical protein
MSASPDADDGHEYLNWHVYNELRWLLVSAATWAASEPQKLDHGVDHLAVMAMDSALLHARNLYEFWNGDHGSIERVFGARGPRSALRAADGDDLKKALDRKVLHLATACEVTPHGDDDDLHKRVDEIARDVLACWDDWRDSATMAPYRQTMDRLRARAVNEATHAAKRLGGRSPFHHRVVYVWAARDGSSSA